jgi:hypothetical protein
MNIKQASYALSDPRCNRVTFEIPSGEWNPREELTVAAGAAIDRALVAEPVNGWQTGYSRDWRASVRGTQCTVSR